MANIKKIILSAALLGGVLAVGGGLTTHAEEVTETPTLTENFSFDEEFNYSNGGVVTKGAGSNASLQNISTEVYTNELIHDSNLNEDYLKISFHADTATSCSGTNYVFRPNGGSGNVIDLATSENKDVVIKIRFKTGTENRKTFRLYMAGGNYDVINLYRGNLYYAFNNTINGSDPDYETFGPVSVNEWHEAVIILKDNGAPADASSASPDRIYLYLDNQFIYEKSFKNGKNYNGQVSQLIHLLHASNKTNEETCIDYIRVGAYNAPLAAAPAVGEVKTDLPFEISPAISGVNPAFLPSITPSYSVDFQVKNSAGAVTKATEGDTTTYSLDNVPFMTYSKATNKYTALTANELTATVTFDNFIEPIHFDLSVSENVEPIPVTDILVNPVIQNNKMILGVGETFDVSKLFTADPSTADDLTLSYTVDNQEIASLTDTTLTALSSGETKLTVTANGGVNVTKEVTIRVTNGIYNGLNSYELADAWTEAKQTHSGLTSIAYSNKEYSPISVVEDPLFGKTIKFTGVGATKNGSGSHLDIHFPVAMLSANKDYKITGWVKMDKSDITSSDAKLDVKIIAYFNQEEPYGYAARGEDPYHMEFTAVTFKTAGNGWVYFETGIVNMDTNAIKYTFAGLKVEMGTYNTQAGVDTYVSHLNLVEQDTVEFVDWELKDSTGLAQERYTVNAGSTFQLNAVAVPSAATMTASFVSSDETIATVDANGLVTFLDKAGTVTITAKVGNSEKVVTFVVTKKAQSITGNTNLEINIDEFDKFSETSSITVTPADTTSEFDVVVADGTICKAELIDNKLWLSDIAVGTTTITITAKDNPEATLVITVTIKGFTLTYDAQGHGEVTQLDSKVTKIPATLPTPTATGYTFGGWFLDAACTQGATEGAAITADTTLYAKWTEVQTVVNYAITYDVQGHGTAPAAVQGNKLPDSLPVLTAEGYTFGGWFLDAACTQEATEGAAITADTTLYAKWTQNSSTDEPTPTTPEQPETPETSNKGLHPGAVAGIVIAVVVTLGLAGGLVFYFMKKKKAPKTNTTPEDKE